MRKLLLLFLFAIALRARAQENLSDHWIAFKRAGAPSSDLQCFTPDNVIVSGGYLILKTEARIAICRSYDLIPFLHRYTSGFVAMRTFSFLYGTVEVRAKFGGGAGSGAWPAIWLADASCQPSDPTGTDDHCNEQEIDVAEVLGGNFANVNQQIHVNHFKYNDGCKPAATDTAGSFHVYGLEWSPGSLVFKIDGVATCTIRQPYVPMAPMYLKISVFAGRLGGVVKRGSLPWNTLIDYVTIIQGGRVIFNDDFGAPHLPQQAGR